MTREYDYLKETERGNVLSVNGYKTETKPWIPEVY